MEPEKTLLQQIREKEQEFAVQIEAVKAETDYAIAAAEEEAEGRLCDADTAGTTRAEQFYWEEKGKIEARVADMKSRFSAERDTALARAEKNRAKAAEFIVDLVTMK